MSNVTKPKVGDLVLYVHKVDSNKRSEAPNVSPAVVTEVIDADKYLVSLFVMNVNGVFFVSDVPNGTKTQRGCWYHRALDSTPNV